MKNLELTEEMVGIAETLEIRARRLEIRTGILDNMVEALTKLSWERMCRPLEILLAGLRRELKIMELEDARYEGLCGKNCSVEVNYCAVASRGAGPRDGCGDETCSGEKWKLCAHAEAG